LKSEPDIITEGDRDLPQAAPVEGAEFREESSDRQHAEWIGEFVCEAQHHLAHAVRGLHALQRHPDDRVPIDGIFRAFHTIKGIAGFLRLRGIEVLAHETESLVGVIRDGSGSARPAHVELLQQSCDLMGRIIASPDCAPGGLTPDFDVMMVRLRCAAGTRSDRGQGVIASRAAGVEAPNGIVRAGLAHARATSGESAHVHVSMQQLERLEFVVAELERARLDEPVDPEDRSCEGPHLDVVLFALREMLMTLRTVEIDGILRRMEDVVSDLSMRTAKTIRCETSGIGLCIDRAAAADVSGVLMHLVRNACDHGIEPIAARVEAGKPKCGVIAIRACERGDGIVVEVSDDGRGIHREQILAAAVERGIVTREAGRDDVLSDRDVLHLIFSPGFSTAAQVTTISGRGVGLDVVRDTVEALSGRIDVRSVPGSGTTFRVWFPAVAAPVRTRGAAAGRCPADR